MTGSAHTLLRALEYEALSGLRLKGRVLDLGGGANNSYYGLLRFEGRVDSANIDLAMRPTLLADLNRPLPLRDGSFDSVVSFNTFEHLRHDTVAVSEALRVLRPGGEFHFIVPFLYQVHASPSDYHRHTAQWWFDHLTTLGVAAEELTIEPLVWDRRSSALSFIGHGPVGRFFRRLLALPPVLLDAWLHDGDRLPPGRESDRTLAVALGYYIRGSAPAASSTAKTLT